MMKKTLFITGGHLTPALAVINEMTQTEDWEIYYLGRKTSLEGSRQESIEYQLISTRSDLKFLELTTGRLQRSFTRYTIPSLIKVGIGFIQSFLYFFQYHPRAVLSFGGYLALPVAVVAWFFRVPVVTHEQTINAGLANRLISRFARKILISWQASQVYFPPDKVVFTGNPVRQEVFQINSTPEFNEFKVVKNKSKNWPVLYFTGGNQGSRSINEIILSALPKLLENHLIIHSSGTKLKYDGPHAERYFNSPYITPDNIGWVFNESDIVIGRSGANTVIELAALGKVALLIPLPWSGQAEQLKNAHELEKFGGAVILEQKDLTVDSLIANIDLLENDFPKYQKAALKSKSLFVPNSSKLIIAQLEKVLS